MISEKITKKDKKALIVGLSLLILLISYIVILDPLIIENERLNMQIKSQSLKLTELNRIVESVKTSNRTSAIQQKNESLLLIVDKSINQYTLKPAMKRISPIGQHKVNINFEQANFNQFYNWLVHLHQNYLITVESLNLQKKDSNIANIQLVLTI